MKHLLWLTGLVLLFCVQSAQAKADLRLIALSPHTVEMLAELGLLDNIVGTVDYADYPEQAKSIPRVGGAYGLSIEKIVALKPDTIVAWSAGNQANDLIRLKQLGLNVIDSSPEKLIDVANDFRRIGQALGVSKKAEEIAKAYERELLKIEQNYSHKKQLQAFYQLWPEPMMTVNQETWSHQLLRACGVANVFAQQPSQYPQISIENVVVRQPEVIIIPQERGAPDAGKDLWLKWQKIPAVKNNNFVSADADTLHRFTSRMLVGLAQLCADLDQLR